jgi:hypothetical protein
MKIFEWIKELVMNDQFHSQAYQLLPTKLNLINNNLSKQFNDAFDFSIQNCRFIRNRKNELLKINEVIMDSTLMSKQSSFINIDSMQEYVAGYSFIDYDSNLKELGVKEFTWKNCINMFQSDIFLKTHSTEHNKRMIEYFYSKSSNIDIQQIPFLIDENNRLQLIKNIYFPGEINYLSIHQIIFNWLNENQQKQIKEWLQKLGLKEQNYLTYFREIICDNPSSYITPENAIQTIEMIFRLSQTNDIKKELSRLKQLKLLTTRGNLIAAEECFFSDQYKPLLPLEEYLKTKEDKFLSFDYVIKGEKVDLFEWRRFFMMLGVQEELHVIEFPQKLKNNEAIEYGFHPKYLSMISGRYYHINAYSGLKTITFLKHTTSKFYQ